MTVPMPARNRTGDPISERVSDTFQYQTTGEVPTPKQTVGLAHVLAGIRKQESGTFRGDYQQKGPFVGGAQLVGAYNINRRYWNDWTALAGIPGASIRSEDAQDRVAAYVVNSYYQRFGTWELAAMAWFAGPQEAAKVLRRGYVDTDSIQNPKIKEYVNTVLSNANTAMQPPNGAWVKHIPISELSFSGDRSWVMPVAGTSEWGRGSWMPNTKTHRGRTHAAIDVYAKEGTPIVAPVAGRVVSTKTGPIGGHTVRVLGDDGITYYFAHMANEAVVEDGSRVLPGYHLGYVGTSGSAQGTSPHLHFSMRDGNKVVNPISFLERGATATQRMPTTDDVSLRQPGMPVAGPLTGWLQDLSSSIAGGSVVTPEEAQLPEEQTLDNEKTVSRTTSTRTPEQEARMQ